jgi:hypothetical protein
MEEREKESLESLKGFLVVNEGEKEIFGSHPAELRGELNFNQQTLMKFFIFSGLSMD